MILSPSQLLEEDPYTFSEIDSKSSMLHSLIFSVDRSKRIKIKRKNAKKEASQLSSITTNRISKNPKVRNHNM